MLLRAETPPPLTSQYHDDDDDDEFSRAFARSRGTEPNERLERTEVCACLARRASARALGETHT